MIAVGLWKPRGLPVNLFPTVVLSAVVRGLFTHKFGRTSRAGIVAINCVGLFIPICASPAGRVLFTGAACGGPQARAGFGVWSPKLSYSNRMSGLWLNMAPARRRLGIAQFR